MQSLSKNENVREKNLKNEELRKCFRKIDSEFTSDPDFHTNVKSFACTFGVKVANLKGNLEITEQSYLNAQNNTTGKQ
jgi:hypothetical protein